MVRRIARNVAGIQETVELEANKNSNTDKIYNLELAHRRDNETLLQTLAETRVEAIELRVRRMVYERHLLEVERQQAELRVRLIDARRR